MGRLPLMRGFGTRSRDVEDAEEGFAWTRSEIEIMLQWANNLTPMPHCGEITQECFNFNCYEFLEVGGIRCGCRIHVHKIGRCTGKLLSRNGFCESGFAFFWGGFSEEWGIYRCYLQSTDRERGALLFLETFFIPKSYTHFIQPILIPTFLIELTRVLHSKSASHRHSLFPSFPVPFKQAQ